MRMKELAGGHQVERKCEFTGVQLRSGYGKDPSACKQLHFLEVQIVLDA
jgi:hypothetical protein